LVASAAAAPWATAAASNPLITERQTSALDKALRNLGNQEFMLVLTETRMLLFELTVMAC
jgi:hypothetical protein